MANGFSVEDMLERIEAHVLRVETKIDFASKDIAAINAQGCAHRPDDLRRLSDLESWKNKGIVGVITTLIMSLGALIGMLSRK